MGLIHGDQTPNPAPPVVAQVIAKNQAIVEG